MVRSERNTLVVDDRQLSVLASHVFVENDQRLLGRRVFFDEFGNRFSECNAKREYLETARVGHRGAFPIHKLREAARGFHRTFSRLKIQVVGVSEDHLRAELLKGVRKDAFYIRLRSDRNEGGRLDVPVRG